MSSSSKTGGRLDWRGILKAFKPLLWLIIPLIILIINHFLIEENNPDIAKWIRYTAYFMSGIVGLWVAIRIVIYLNAVLKLWRHDREILRQDPLFVVEIKMRSRLKEVHNKLKRNECGIYNIPFYAVIGQSTSEVETLLLGSGIAFPKDLNYASKKERYEGYEQWYVGNDAVFIDISSLQAPEKLSEWKILLKVLANVRPSAPLNGVLVVLPAEQLKNEDARLRKDYEASIQKNLQLMQERLLVKFPVYILISELDKLAGFTEFFGDLKDNDRGQMIGWSGKGTFKKPAYLETLTEDLVNIKFKLEYLMLKRMVEQKNTQHVDLSYIFVSEFNVLLKRVVDFIGKVFNPDAYLEPVSLRGFYFIGGISEGRQSIVDDVIGEGQTVIGNGISMRVDAATMIGKEIDSQGIGSVKNWFCRDFFYKKLIPESGTICRPKWMVKKQTTIKIVAAATFFIQLFFVGGLLYSEATKTSNWREESAEIIQRAQYLLSKKVTDKQDAIVAQSILEDIVIIMEGVKTQGLFKGATSIGLGGEVTNKLNNIHSLIYQKYFLQSLIKSVELDIARWDGKDREFEPFGRKLIEYIRWSNPNYSGELSIDPFVSREKDAVSKRYTLFLLKHFIQKRADYIARMTDNKAVARISKALESVNGSSRITVPLESGPKDRLPGESEWEWWQRLSGKLEGFSETTKKFLNVESPFVDRQEKDISDQIYYITKMVGQMMSSVLEMEGFIEEGKKKYPTWISSLEDFFPEMEKAAVRWPPMLEVIKKCEERNEFAYSSIVTPLLNKEMAWVQTFVGVGGGQLAPILDRLVNSQTDIIDVRQIDIYRETGRKYMEFLKSFNGYLVGFGELIKKSGSLVSGSTYYSGEELMKKLETVKKELADLTALENKSAESAAVLDGILAEIAKESGKEEEIKAKDGVKKNILKYGKSAIKDLVSGVELKKQVLTKFSWYQISDWLKKWQPGLKNEKAYLASIYWMELFDWFKPFTKNEMKGGSYASILRMNLFMQKNAQYFTEDIEKFLDDWLTSVPTEIVALLAEEGAIQKNPGLKDFYTLYNQVKKFKETYLPELRKSATLFVSAVNLMDPDAQKTWRKLTEGSEAELNWDALEAFSKFKEEYEVKEGIALRNITGSLEEIQIALTKTLNGELGKKFEDAWNKVVNKLKAKNTDTKFPFVQEGPSASKEEALDAITEFVEFGMSLGIVKSEDGTTIELTGQSQKIMDRIVPTVRRDFLEKCVAYKDFLAGEGEKMPEVIVELTPGEIGKHYHWVRMFIGQRRYYDLSVYGEKKVTIDLASAVGGIKFGGLDVGKDSLAEQTVTKGDLGLLQFVYTNGKSIDKEKTKWRVLGSLASSSSGGEQVSFELLFTFNKPVPQLPILPG